MTKVDLDEVKRAIRQRITERKEENRTNIVRRDKAFEDLAESALYISEDDPAVARRSGFEE